MRGVAAVPTLCALVIVAAGCATTPAARFYTLSAVATPPAATSALSVAVGPVSVPAVVDRPQIVVTKGPNEVHLDEFNRWAAPLENNIARVVAENLVTMLGARHVTLLQDAVTVDADFRVAIQVQRFESILGEGATLDAVWTVSRNGDGKSQTGRTTVSEPAPERAYDAVVAAHSRAIARLSGEIAQAVQALARSGP